MLNRIKCDCRSSWPIKRWGLVDQKLNKIGHDFFTFDDQIPGHLVIGEVFDLLGVRGRGGNFHGCDIGGGHLCLSWWESQKKEFRWPKLYCCRATSVKHKSVNLRSILITGSRGMNHKSPLPELPDFSYLPREHYEAKVDRKISVKDLKERCEECKVWERDIC